MNSSIIADQLESRSIDELIPNIRHPRNHADSQISQIADCVVEYGFEKPVLIDGAGVIIAGHARVLASRKLRCILRRAAGSKPPGENFED
jgi:ParB-like chromosome segregation protein Spo0J